MENILLVCKFCGAEKKNRNSLRNHERLCKDNPNRQKSALMLYNEGGHKGHNQYTKARELGLPDPICSEETRKKLSENGKGRKHTEETKKKLSDLAKARNLGGCDAGNHGGRGKRGYYKGLYCMSTWELAWVVYQLEHGKKVEQCKDRFPYIMDGEVHNYTPDFIMDGVYYEIKNWHRPDTDYKVKFFPKNKTLVLIEGDENKFYLDYVENKYGKKFYDLLYEVKNYQVKKKHSEFLEKREIIKNERWNIIQSSDIDFSKYGWVGKISELFGISENKAGDYIKRNFPEFYRDKCFKKKC